MVTRLYNYLYYQILNTWPSGMLLDFMLNDHTNMHSTSISRIYLESVCLLILLFRRCFARCGKMKWATTLLGLSYIILSVQCW
jgi:hypothetical protein